MTGSLTSIITLFTLMSGIKASPYIYLEKRITFENAPTTTKKASTSTKKATATTKNATTTKAATITTVPTSTANPLIVPSLPTTSTVIVTASSTPNISSSKNQSSGLTGGAIGGIVASIIIILIGIVSYLIIRKKRNNKQKDVSKRGLNEMYTAQPPMQQQQHIQPEYQHQYGTYIPSPPPPVPSTKPNNIQTYQPATTTNFSEPSIGIFTVIATYTPTLSDELAIQVGDQIEVLAEYDDGWCQGVNLTRGHTKGVFPKHCTNMVDPNLIQGNSIKRSSSIMYT